MSPISETIMSKDRYLQKAYSYINTLCTVKPNRRTGSVGNRAATEFFAQNIQRWGYEIDTNPFLCLDYRSGICTLKCGDANYEVFISPYSRSCRKTAILVTASTVEELEAVNCTGKILIMRGELCAEQLMPKNFVFYNPEHHKHIYALLESKRPAAIVTATSQKPELVGALYPFPLIEDGDFNIPSVYCTDVTGNKVARKTGQIFELTAQGKRIASTASNVIATKNLEASNKIIICAHIDAYGSSPGALDNASGTTVLLLLAEMLKDRRIETGLEFIAFNGEDNYSAGGQMDYLRRYGEHLNKVALTVNIDDVAYIHGQTAFSAYGCPDVLQKKVRAIFGEYSSLAEGAEWYQGDHMIFVQKGIPTIALTSDRVAELMSNIMHTDKDTADKVACRKLVELAEALRNLVISF